MTPDLLYELNFSFFESWLPFSLLCIATEIVDLYTNSGTKLSVYIMYSVFPACMKYECLKCVKASHLLLLRRYDVCLSALPFGRRDFHCYQPHPVRNAQLQLPKGVPDCGGENKNSLQRPGYRSVKRLSVVQFIVVSIYGIYLSLLGLR